MDHNDRQAIEGLFGKLSDVERQSGPRDAEAETYIKDRVSAQPASPYFMAQTIVVQEQALSTAQQRIEELEYQLANRPAAGGLLSSLFGGGRPSPRPTMPRPAPHNAPSGMQPGQPAAGPWGQQGMQPRGGGFLAGAAQTAMGVAGGVLLGNAIAGILGGDEAQAAEDKQPEDEANIDDGLGDMEF
ncbi:DUF2076 domain-containing protein [Rhizobiaceae bacterium n13]|uniref:DUF2076 domain-containing protein n=1 Tax=Ferirhizobium litorale TaxID=2927786 RepID=A0AAE3U1I0_9HYPH|nr:DUF2076 domain-containing protein [Fererhizobium litorale]MDI7862320.1 DUF2076 domain-containing protein [Fererhizobium litorale]MDI7922406.1 DUF2076 domain-containing protein [Fererhizobium litorale]